MSEAPLSVVVLNDPDAEGAASVLDRLRAEAAESVTGLTVDISVPGYTDVELVARYGFLAPDRTKAIGEMLRTEHKKASPEDKLLIASIDILIEACQGIYVRVNGALEPLDPDGGGPVTYDDRLAAALAVDAGSAREVLRAAFRRNDYAIVEHGQRLQRWLGDTSRDVSDDALGEA